MQSALDADLDENTKQFVPDNTLSADTVPKTVLDKDTVQCVSDTYRIRILRWVSPVLAWTRILYSLPHIHVNYLHEDTVHCVLSRIMTFIRLQY